MIWKFIKTYISDFHDPLRKAFPETRLFVNFALRERGDLKER